MRTIRAKCPSCTQEVDLRPTDITLHLTPPETNVIGWSAEDPGSSYAFGCPVCGDLAVKPAGPRVIELLIEGGVEVSTEDTAPWQGHRASVADDRPPHPESPPAGAPLTYDDLLDLHLLLEEDSWYEQLLTQTFLGRS